MATDGVTTSNPHILIVEDEFLILMDLEAQVQSWSLGPTVGASHLNEALDAIGRLPIAAAIVDVHLHGHNSFELTDILLSRQIPIVLSTAAPVNTLPEKYQALPVVSKPFDPVALRAALTAALASTRVARQ